MRKIVTIIAAVAAIAGVASGCGGSDGSTGGAATTSGNAKKATLTLNFVYSGHYAPFFLGQEKGYFADEGIDLTIRPGSGSLTTVRAVGAGKTDFGWADAPSIIKGVAAGIPVKSVGAYEQVGTSAVMTLAGNGIDTPADLRGKSVGITPGDALSQTFPAFLRANHIEQQAVKIVNVDAAGKIPALASGQVDAIVGFSDNQGPAVEAKAHKSVKSFPYGDSGVKLLGLGLLTSTHMLQDDPQLVQHMVNAVTRSWQAALEDPDAAVQAMVDAVGPEAPAAPLLRKQLDLDLPVIKEGDQVGVNTDAEWKQTISLLAKYGGLDDPKAPDAYWDPSFSRKAVSGS